MPRKSKPISMNPKKKSRFRIGPVSILAALILVAVFFGYRQFVSYNLSKANQFVNEEEYAKASRYFSRTSNMPFTRGVGQDGLGVIALLQGEVDAASGHFQAVLEQKPSRFGANPGIALEKFTVRGMYHTGKIYRDFLTTWKPREELSEYFLDFALLALGNRELAEARRLLSNAPPKAQNSEKYRFLMDLTDQYERDGEIPVVLDRTGKAYVVFHLETSDLGYATPQLFVGWPPAEENRPGSLLVPLDAHDRLNRISTTLDLNLQKCAYQAMKGFDGSIVLVDVHSGEVLAGYGSEGIDPFSSTFEPGSVIKLLTYGFFLQGGGNTALYVPKNYPSSMSVDGRIFYDWQTQGQIDTIEEGVAVSCNLLFAQMGIDMGWPDLESGFDKILDGRTLPHFFTAPTFGRLTGAPENDYALGRVAIGLDLVEATPLGLAMIAALIGNQGVLEPPKLIHEFRTIQGRVYKQVESAHSKKIFKDTVAQQLSQAMQASVEDPRGTARRAQVDFVRLAAKTGTAGERPFDAIILGFLPADRPVLAFSVYLKGGGKAEINGAMVTRNLVEFIHVLAPDYLER